MFSLALLAVVALLTGAHRADAAGSYKLQSLNMAEVGGGWHLFMTLELPQVPATAHTPIRFTFSQTTAYRLALVDGKDGPQPTKETVSPPKVLVSSQDVDFSDGSGKIFKKTRFDFSVTRSIGFTPGEYKLQVQTSDGANIGAMQSVVLDRSTDPNDPNLKGDIDDTRAMNFDNNKNGVKKIDNGVDAGPKATTQGEAAAPQTGDVQPAGSASSFIPDSAYSATPEELGKDHPSGCGCSTPGMGAGAQGFAASLSLLGLGAIVVGRRRARRSGSRPQA